MPSTASSSASKSHSPEDEYIDIIDVLAFLWRAKVFVITGILLGLVGAIAVTEAKKPAVYVTTMPVSLEVAGGITGDGIIAKFNGLLGRADVRSAMQSAGVSNIGGKLPFRLKNDSAGVSLEVSSLVADAAGEKALGAVKSLATAARDLNKKMSEAADLSPALKEPKSDLEVQFARLASAQALEEAPVRTKLFALESKLAQKSGIRPAPAAVLKGTAIGDDVLRLLGAADGKLPAAERDAVISEYSQLVGAIKAVQAKYEQPLVEMTSALGSLSAGLIKSATGEGDNYPVIAVNEAAYKASVAAGIHERYESKRLLFAILGILLGGILGLMVFDMSRFFTENRDRMRAIF